MSDDNEEPDILDDPLLKSRQLIRRFAKEMEELGLQVVTASINPSIDGGSDKFSAIMMVNPEALMTNEERDQKNVDDAFNKLISGANLQESEADQALKRRLRGAVDGIGDLLDDD
jgi:hypothetical protein